MTLPRRAAAALGVILCASLCACSLFSQRPQTHRYLLPAPRARVEVPARFNLRVRSVKGIAPFEDTGIAHQVSAYQLDSYRYNRWVAPPTEMVADALHEIIRIPPDSGSGATRRLMLLDARIDAFQHVDYGGKEAALVAIEFCLSSDKPLAPCRWRRKFSREVTAINGTPEAAVEAFAAAYAQVLTEFAANLTSYLQTAPASPFGENGPPPNFNQEGTRRNLLPLRRPIDRSGSFEGGRAFLIGQV
jgi:ABC-type uncharacterized transport system auxiliary subunit